MARRILTAAQKAAKAARAKRRRQLKGGSSAKTTPKLHYHPRGKGTGGSVVTQVAAMQHAKSEAQRKRMSRELSAAAKKKGGRLTKKEALAITNRHLGHPGQVRRNKASTTVQGQRKPKKSRARPKRRRLRRP